MRQLLGTMAILAVTGCTELPDVGIPVPDSQADPDYPDLVNLRTLELTAAEKDADALRAEQEADARVARLRARAEKLRSIEVN